MASAVMGWSAAAWAQGTATAPEQRVWVDLNFGTAAAAGRTFQQSVSVPLFEESAEFGAAYRLPTGASFDVGGGGLITPIVGIGLSVTGTAHEDEADLSIRIPHPFFFSAFAADTAPTDSRLTRAEGGVHIQLMVVPYDRNGVRLRVFAGPSRFTVRQDLVRDIRYDQVFGVFTRSNTARITEFEAAAEVEASGWGFHLGGDLTWFFSRSVGLGGFVRVMRGSVALENVLRGNGTIDVKAGGVQTGGGVRFRF